jgi:hypothetical protein
MDESNELPLEIVTWILSSGRVLKIMQLCPCYLPHKRKEKRFRITRSAINDQRHFILTLPSADTRGTIINTQTGLEPTRFSFPSWTHSSYITENMERPEYINYTLKTYDRGRPYNVRLYRIQIVWKPTPQRTQLYGLEALSRLFIPCTRPLHLSPYSLQFYI